MVKERVVQENPQEGLIFKDDFPKLKKKKKKSSPYADKQ